MKNYRAIIWDLDGTLADTSEGIYNSIRYVQDTLGLPELTESQLRAHIGPPIAESYMKNFNISGNLLAEALKLHREYAVKQGVCEAKLYPGIFELLKMLKEDGKKQAVATLKYEETAKKMLSHLGILDFFDAVYGPTFEIHSTKAQLLEKCLETFKLPKKEVVLVGDSSYDAAGALEVGIDFLAVIYGFGFSDKKDIESYSHIGCVESVESIMDFK